MTYCRNVGKKEVRQTEAGPILITMSFHPLFALAMSMCQPYAIGHSCSNKGGDHGFRHTQCSRMLGNPLKTCNDISILTFASGLLEGDAKMGNETTTRECWDQDLTCNKERFAKVHSFVEDELTHLVGHYVNYQLVLRTFHTLSKHPNFVYPPPSFQQNSHDRK